MSQNKKPLSTLGKLSREHPTLVDTLVRHGLNLDDRSIGVVGGADVESALELEMARAMVELSKSEFIELFSGDGAPLGTFGAKIKVGYAMGVFGKRTRADLELVRKVRNVFAHARRPIDFETPEIALACSKLEIPDRFPNAVTTGAERRHSEPRRRFENTCTVLAFSLTFQKFKEDNKYREDEGNTSSLFDVHPLD